ncbi:hypothetical protein HanRHA438_Chr17g0802191 [Helianthus annuus]|nr:hypothetical protein HanRHA438_Chr17g0802191 [Helianthus annuus]
MTADNDKKLRRWVVVVVVVEGVECLQRMGRRGLGVEVVGVMRVGEAMVMSE